MVGQKCSAEKLNNTLSKVIQLLNKNNITNWFICYGTLLGLVREDSCIDNDDDIDIIIHKSHFDDVKMIMINNNFELEYGYGIRNSRDIIKTKENNNYTSVDIYMADFNGNDVYDRWNRLNIRDCFLDKEKKTFMERIWRNQKLYLPKNYIRILTNRYGIEWIVKQDKKIAQTMTKL